MEQLSISYREIVPDLSYQEEWNEITLNTGGTQSTLQDIKVSEKSGGFCFKNISSYNIKNHFIYWRTYQDVLELSEISMDFNMHQNNLRYKFTDTPVLSVTVTEQQLFVTFLVTTVSSLHRISFTRPNSNTSAENSVDKNETSIFSEASSSHNLTSSYFIEQNASSNNPIPHVAESILSESGDIAYFALAYQTHLILYLMNSSTGHTTAHILKDHSIMPRLFSNLKGALIGKSNSYDNDNAISLLFNIINGEIFLFALYRDGNLRMWSTVIMQNVCSINCFCDNVEKRMQGHQNNSLRKINGHSLCAFLSHSVCPEFACIDINGMEYGMLSISLTKKRYIQAPQLDLIDFNVSDGRIWALWCNAEGEFSISSFFLIPGVSENWIPAALEPPPNRYLLGIDQGMDPRQAYCSYIFHPGKFDRNVIANALFMFRRCSVRFDAKNCHISLLKEHVCQSVEEEIQNEIRDFDVTDNEYLEISARLWERFYSCCEQYHMKACQPTGLLILDPIDAVLIIKKNTFSFLRPCETLEHLMLQRDSIEVNSSIPMIFTGYENVSEDLMNLIAIIAQIEKWLPEDVKMDLDTKLYQLEAPSVLISTIAKNILEPEKNILPHNFMTVIRNKLEKIRHIKTTLSALLDSLRMDNGNPERMHMRFDCSDTSQLLLSFGTIFAGNIGISILSETVRQMAQIRFALCRNFLILQQLLIETFSLSSSILEIFQAHLMPETEILLHSYYVMIWISETTVNLSASASLESSIQRLHLHIAKGFDHVNAGKVNSVPLLRVFLKSKALNIAIGLYVENFKTFQNKKWQNTLVPVTTIINQLIWTVSSNFVFGEWLLSTCQHTIIQDYVRLLNNWCKWNIFSRKFILAVSLLDCGESYKAYDLFLQGVKGLFDENFLKKQILKDSFTNKESECELNISTRKKVMAQYYLKVIQLFEQHSAVDHIISIAQVAINILPENDSQLPMFQCILFNNHLLLEHYEEAYLSLTCNSDLGRQKDCLRQLVVTLFTTKRFDVLMNFPYIGLREDFESIVESRARSLSMENNKIYDFLYAFHVNNDNMRKASSIIYEQAMRLQVESDSIELLQRRCSSLLICINALYLIDQRYRWIAKPAIEDDCPMTRKMDIDETLAKEQVVVLEIQDVRKEFLQTEALIRFARHRKKTSPYFNADPQQLATILANCGLFTAAIKLAKGVNINFLPIFDSLTAACVRTAFENPNEAWSWLQENDLADLPHRNKTADMAWSLLRKLVEDNEERNITTIKRSVVSKLLSLNAFVPQWLYDSYKASNCAELVRLFVRYNRLLEASNLMIEIFRAMLGAGSEYFNFKYPIGIRNSEMCSPLQPFDILLLGLKLNQDIGYKQAATELEGVFQSYIKKVIQTADNKIQNISLQSFGECKKR